MPMSNGNIDSKTVKSFGDEWQRFDQANVSNAELSKGFSEYFSVFPWNIVDIESVGFDMGCGSGRWARFVAPKVGHLNCIDPSLAIHVAEKELNSFNNISFFNESVSNNSLIDGSQDFGYSLGVLHHVPDTENAIKSCVKLLKPGAPFLLYLYYNLDNSPYFYKAIWRVSNIFRRIISKKPLVIKNLITDMIAIFLYLPLAVLSKLLDSLNVSVDHIPLSYYRNRSFYTMRTDSRDRFGTPLERRFNKEEIKDMMTNSGLENIKFSDDKPFWCAVGIKK